MRHHSPDPPEISLREYISIIGSTEINERPVKLITWTEEQGRQSEFLHEYIYQEDQAILYPLSPISERGFIFVPIAIAELHQLTKEYTANEAQTVESNNCAYCGESIDSRDNAVSLSRVHVFPFHTRCYTNLIEDLSEAVDRFSGDIAASNI